MTTYILVVYFLAGGKLTYPLRFDALAACQHEAEAQLEHRDAVAGAVCIESRPTAGLLSRRK